MVKTLAILILVLLTPFESLKALTVEEFTKELEQDYYSGVKPVNVDKASIPWEVFASTKSKMHCKKDKEGLDYCINKPTYSDQIRRLDKKEIQITGYMFPLEPSEKQNKFLIGAYPISCPFHYHSNPNQVIEVNAKKPINFSYDPINIKGVLSLESGDDNGSFYKLSI